ncbi:SseB family protein [Leucobacter chromiireducens]|uniref:SseB family protein n=1 Tax=Leucobacter chromiireducens TaxID=283877 RepID=UPI000F6334F2|nr:SseB family protein [Leucobacter chromiireducens]
MAIKKLPSTGDAPRSTGVPESLVPGGAADSAGFPWAGRTFDHHGTAFAEDDGATPVLVAAAVAELRAAAAAAAAASDAATHWAAVAQIAAAHGRVIAELGSARVLVPMLAEAGDLGVTPEGKTVEKTQELSIVTVAAPDGRRVLPVFSSVTTLATWHESARPIPVPATQAALAAVQELTDLIILDAATPDLEYGIRRPALRALALGEPYVPAWADDEVLAAFRAGVAGEPAVVELWLAPGDPEGRLRAPEVDVHVSLAPGLDRAALTALLERAQAGWASSEVIAERVDSMRVRPRSAP